MAFHSLDVYESATLALIDDADARSKYNPQVARFLYDVAEDICRQHLAALDAALANARIEQLRALLDGGLV